MKREGFKSSWAAAAILIAVGAAAYATALGAGFVYLDFPAIVQNPTIRHGLDWRSILDPPTQGGLTVGGRPLVNLTLALNYAAGGLNPWGYHLFNVLVHLASTVVLFGLVRRVLRRREGEGWEPDLAAMSIAGVWAVHPLATEAVSYVIQRAESLMGLCYLLTLYGFVRYATDRGRGLGWAAASVLACALGMTAKEVMVSAPVLVLLLDRALIAPSFGQAWRARRGYYMALAATWVPLALLVAHGGGDRGGTAGFDLGFSWWGYVRTQFPAICRYLRLALWPHPLNFYYTPSWAFSPREVAATAALVIALATVSVWGALRGKIWGFLGTGFFAILAPTSLVPGLSQTMAEHRMYLALIPVVILAVAGLRQACARLGAQPRRAGFAAAAAVWIAVLGIATSERNRVYRDEITLWGDTARRSPDNAFVLNNLGVALAAANRPADAIAPLTRAVAFKPDYAGAEDNLALALAESGRAADAVPHYRRALALQPHNPEAEANLGLAEVALNRPQEAVADFQRALAEDGGNAAARANLAATLARLERWDEASREFQTALAADPTKPELHYDFANVLAARRRWADAAREYRSALQLGLKSSDAQANLGAALASLGQWADAIASYRSALELAPSDPDIHYNLALALRASGRASDADAEWAASERLRAASGGRGP